MDGTSAASTHPLYPISFPFFLRFLMSLPVINVRCGIRYNEPGSEHTSPQMSNFRSPHWGNCKHKSSKVYNFRDSVLSIVIFPVQKHFSKGRRCIHLSHGALFCEIMERDFASASLPCSLSQFAWDRRGSVALPH